MTAIGKGDGDIFRLERPEAKLFTYYLLTSFLAGPFFVFPLLFLTFRYRTLRYRFDEEGISMRWGILFRREIHLTYSRIQDIHLVSNVVERWLGLARISIQTASGSSKAEMTVEGFSAFEAVRDFLYSRMRGARQASERPIADADAAAAAGGAIAGGSSLDAASGDELTAVLRAVAGELAALRRDLAARSPHPPHPSESGDG